MDGEVSRISFALKARGDNEITEAAIILCHRRCVGGNIKKIVSRIAMIGEKFDESDNQLGSKILLEETGCSLISTKNASIETYQGSDVNSISSMIADIIIDFSQGYEHSLDYVLGVDTLDENNSYDVSVIKELVEDAICKIDESLIPTYFTEIYTVDPYISNILNKFKIDESYFSPDSVLSGAIWGDILLDKSMGK